MGLRIVQLLLVLACVHLSTFSKIEKVNPRWRFNDNNNTKSLPDTIEFDLELDSGQITLILIKQSPGSVEPPLTITRFEGQSSIWEQPKEILGTYKDPSFDATATLTFKNVGGYNETFYMITFTHDETSISLGPKAIFASDPFLNNGEEDVIDIKIKSKLLNVDGVPHLLFESPSIEPFQSRQLREDYVSDLTKNARITKRSNKRAEKKLMTIEIFTMMDYSLYKKIYDESKAATDREKDRDAIQTILYIFTHIMQKVNIIFERIHCEHYYYKLSTKWTGAYISKNASDTPFIERAVIDDHTIRSDGLNFSKWSEEDNKIKFPKYDLLAVFTSYALKKNDGRYLLGLSNQGSVCENDSIIIVRHNRFFVTASTIAHEIGHSLDVYHDITISRGYLMASGLEIDTSDDLHTSYFFSKSSINKLCETIDRLDRWERNCLTNKGNDFKTPEREMYLNLYPGQIYDPDDQCRLANGIDSRYNGGNEDLCQTLGCTSGHKLSSMDGTPCSNGAWCQRGKCVPDDRAPRAPEHCIYGDYKLAIPKTNNSGLNDDARCEDAEEDPNLCTLETFKHYCCASCAGNRTGGCQDMIEECSQLEPRDCYYGYYTTTCCKTCSALVQNPFNVNCLYGDKGTDCSKLVPEVCHLSTQYCCQTCAPNLSSATTIYNTTIFPSTTSFSSTTISTNSNSEDSCTDFNGTLSCQLVGAKPLLANCKLLVFHNPTFCNDENFQKYCCASCGGVKMVKDSCTKDNDTEAPFKHLSKDGTCKQLVVNMPWLCQTKDMKKQCCKSCGRFTVKPIKFSQ